MTIDLLQTKLDSVFEYGQGYVALSRCKSLEGLSILGFDKSKIRAHPKVIEFYSNLKKDLKNVNDKEDEEFISNKNKKEIGNEIQKMKSISSSSNLIETKSIMNQIDNKIQIKNEKIELIDESIIDVSDDSIQEEWISNYENFKEEKIEIKENKRILVEDDTDDDDIEEIQEIKEIQELKVEEKKKSLKILNGLIIGAKCINNHQEHPITHLFKKNHWIESNNNDSLLIFLPFTEKVIIERITFDTKEDETKPNEIKIYLNEGELNLEDLKDVIPQENFKQNVNSILFENKTKHLDDMNVSFFFLIKFWILKIFFLIDSNIWK